MQGLSGNEKDIKELHEFLKKQDNLGKSPKDLDVAICQLDPKGEA